MFLTCFRTTNGLRYLDFFLFSYNNAVGWSVCVCACVILQIADKVANEIGISTGSVIKFNDSLI